MDERREEESRFESSMIFKEIRNDDLEFAMATREWASVINESNFEGYKKRFMEAGSFFEGQLAEGNKLSAKLIQKLRENTK